LLGEAQSKEKIILPVIVKSGNSAQQGGIINVAQYLFCDMASKNGSIEPPFRITSVN
jgi:hypothetical protein